MKSNTRILYISGVNDKSMEQTDNTISTKYIVLFSIFKAAWDNEPDAKERFMTWLHEDKKKRTILEREKREYKKRLAESIEDCKKALDQRDSSQEEVKRLKEENAFLDLNCQIHADNLCKLLKLESRVKELTESLEKMNDQRQEEGLIAWGKELEKDKRISELTEENKDLNFHKEVWAEKNEHYLKRIMELETPVSPEKTTEAFRAGFIIGRYSEKKSEEGWEEYQKIVKSKGIKE